MLSSWFRLFISVYHLFEFGFWFVEHKPQATQHSLNSMCSLNVSLNIFPFLFFSIFSKRGPGDWSMDHNDLNATIFKNLTHTESGLIKGDGSDWSTETLQQTRYIIQRIIVPCIVTIGIAGNLLTVIVLTRYNHNRLLNFFTGLFDFEFPWKKNTSNKTKFIVNRTKQKFIFFFKSASFKSKASFNSLTA